MKQVINNITNRLLTRQGLALVLILLGLGMTALFGVRAVRSYRQLQYIREQGLDTGLASVEAIQPWMTIRYIGVAYAVPEEYIYAQLEIPFDRRNRNIALGRLNREFGLGRSPSGDYPAILDQVREAILAYRADPVTTGLDDIRPWMTIRYIAASTGVPEDHLFKSLGIAAEDNNQNKPLDLLGREVRYPGGPRAFAEAIKLALSQYEATP